MLITSTPILWFLALLGKAKNTLKEKKLLSYTMLLILSGFILVFFDTQAGGLLQRYVSDFGFIFFGAIILIIFALYENVKTESEKNLLDKLTLSSSFLSISKDVEFPPETMARLMPSFSSISFATVESSSIFVLSGRTVP